MTFKLYKYLPTQYLESTLENGLILFRELDYYKKIEADQKVRYDKNEGGRFLHSSNKPYVKLGEHDISRYVKSFTLNQTIPPNKSVFIYCLSSKFSKDLLEHFAEDDKASPENYCCIEFKKDMLTELVSKRLSDIAPTFKHDAVEYFDETDVSVLDNPPEISWFSKAKIFDYQHEYRLSIDFEKESPFDNHGKLQKNGVDLLFNVNTIMVNIGKLDPNICKVYTYEDFRLPLS